MGDGGQGDELWPIYAAADYAGSGSLLARCRALLSASSLFQPMDATPPTPPVRRDERSDYCTTTTTTTSGYQTLEEQRQQRPSSSIHQNGATAWKARPCAHRPSARSIGPAAQGIKLASWPNKSPLGKEQGRRQDRDRVARPPPEAKRPLWWHLIEPVNYGKLAGSGERATDERDVMDLQLDSLLRARVVQLGQEMARAVRLVSLIARRLMACCQQLPSSIADNKLEDVNCNQMRADQRAL